MLIIIKLLICTEAEREEKMLKTKILITEIKKKKEHLFEKNIFGRNICCNVMNAKECKWLLIAICYFVFFL